MIEANLDMNIFTMEFGKITVPTDEHLDKVEEEYYELCNAYEDYEEAKYENMHPEDIEAWKIKLEDRKKKYLK